MVADVNLATVTNELCKSLCRVLVSDTPSNLPVYYLN